MKAMNRIIIFTILSVLISSPILGAEEISLTPDEAIAIALRDNRDILLKSEDIKKAKYKINEAWTGVLPTANLTGGYSRTQGYYAKDYTSYTSQAGAKLILYQGGKVINTIQYDQHGLSVAEAVLDKTKLEIVFDVKKAFYALLLATDFANLNKNILENTKGHIEAMQARYGKGEVSEQDILKIEASLSSVEQAYEASINQIESSHALLNNLLYLDKDVKIVPHTIFAYTPEDIAYDKAFLNAMKNRPEIRQYEAQEEQAKKAIEIAKADTRPAIYASWDYYSLSRTGAGTTKNWNDYNAVGVNVSWPIFDGFAAKQRVDQAIVDLKEAQLAREKLVKDIALELKNAYVSFKDAVGKLQAVESDVTVYNDNLSSVKEKYQQGIASSLDLSDANLKYDIAMFNKNQAIYDYIVSKSNFDKASGGVR